MAIILMFIVSLLLSDEWGISAQFNIEGLELGEAIFDDSNFLGMKFDATDGYDGIHDIPDPPHSPTHYISFYFPHPEWESLFGDNFTSDYKEFENLSDKISIWNAEIVSDRFNALVSIDFNFINSIESPAYFKLQDVLNQLITIPPVVTLSGNCCIIF